ncbi:CobW family GTP-binding protein [Marinobacterium sediminicola]|uniref:GTPase, G3E family n=1 Tax=Marinobacterium sediminicola TaxID=518898 RepID=A0ABY1RXT9_9GAMM|nr:CobW family GTP-binding protein [Marinobacterium sediminicola]ULG68614.1 GTP-binding protein [Marinobacterium sediminicola]SMR73136.1 GTPase, G3E family [Marinobacterium sediminicola]
MSQAIIQSVPTNIITGFLGSGKTTAINHLLKHKPDDERWAVLVNEFGQVGIDGSLIEQQDGIEVKELAGGCLCCALGPSLPITLATLLRRFRPDRLLIEPTGLGHPARIIDTLQSEQFRSVLTLHSIICLLDPGVLLQPETLRHPSFIDQLNLADIIVLNRTDLADEANITEARELSANLFPPKTAIHATTHGQLAREWLDLDHQIQRQARYPQAHAATPARPNILAPINPPTVAEPSKPVRQNGSQGGYYSYGWIFAAEDRFDWQAIQPTLDTMEGILRLKAVLRIGHAWVSYNRNAGQQADINESAWRRDSRLEILTRQPLAYEIIEKTLIACLMG